MMFSNSIKLRQIDREMRRIDEKCEIKKFKLDEKCLEDSRNAIKKKHSLCRVIHFHHIFLFVYIVNVFDRDVVFDHRFFH
jgi:hypothetical protein